MHSKVASTSAFPLTHYRQIHGSQDWEIPRKSDQAIFHRIFAKEIALAFILLFSSGIKKFASKQLST